MSFKDQVDIFTYFIIGNQRMNRKGGSSELEMDSLSYPKNMGIDGFRNDNKNTIGNKHETVSILTFKY